MDETAVQIIRAEIRRHRSLSTMVNDMQLKVDKEKNNGYQDGTQAHDPGR